jgi:proteic killer suppression protein
VTIYTLQCILLIRRFKHRRLKRLYERGDCGGIAPDLLDTVEDILVRLDEAETPQAMNLPGYRLRPLKGGLKGFWSLTVRANWRIIFRFEGADALDVELTDYQ